MLSRRHLRIKVLQSLYAFYHSGNDNLGLGEKQMLRSIDKLYEQYIHILSFLITLVEFARQRIEDGKKKFIPSEEDLNPNTKFIENQFYKQISSNRDFLKKEEQLKINWVEEQGMIRKLYQNFKASKHYLSYINTNDYSYEADKEIFLSLLKKDISDSESLEQYFEDRDIHWASDYFIAIWLAIKTIKMYKQDWNEYHLLPSILKSEHDGDNEDRDYIIKLFRKTILKNKECEQLIEERAKNWELERIAAMDKLILKMAITELIEFPSIPVKVTLNEYIDLAKVFSTGKSRIFINGILDKLIIDLQKEGKIKKSGRGLMT